MNKALNIIIESGAKPVLIQSTALMQSNFHDCFFKHIKLRQPYNAKQCRFYWNQSKEEQWFDNLFYKMKIKHPELIIINPKKVQCPNNMCKADINGIPIYRDAGHITDYASYQFGFLYLKKWGNPLS